MIRFLIPLFLSLPLLSFTQNNLIDIIPFELKKDNRIYIKCKVNQTDSLNFLFDTGANGTVINSYIIGDKLKLKIDKESDNIGAHGVHKVKISSNNTVQFGQLTESNLDLLTINYGANQFDGVFGTNLIDKYIVEIDYDKRELRLYEPEGYIYPSRKSIYRKFKIGTVNNGGLYTIKTSFILSNKEISGIFILDTGADNAISLSDFFIAQHSFDKKLSAIAKATSIGSEGISIESPIVVLPELKLNNLHFYNIPATLYINAIEESAKKEESGTLGNSFLKRFNIILDIPNMQIFLKPNNLLHSPYYDFLME